MPSVLRNMNPLRLLSSQPGSGYFYNSLPKWDAQNGGASEGSGQPQQQQPQQQQSILTKGVRFFAAPSGHTQRSRLLKSSARISIFAIIFVLVLGFLGGKRYRTGYNEAADEARLLEEHANTRFWEAFERLHGFYNGVRTLVPWNEFLPDPLQSDFYGAPVKKRQAPNFPDVHVASANGPLRVEPIRYAPYPKYNSSEYLREFHYVEPCYLDEDETVPAPDIFVYPGLPQHMALPFFGSYEELQLRHDVCFERFGRLGPYGYGYNAQEGGTGLGMRSEQQGSESVWRQQPKINWQGMDWGSAQKRCYEKNRHRFEDTETTSVTPRLYSKRDAVPDDRRAASSDSLTSQIKKREAAAATDNKEIRASSKSKELKKRRSRTAYVLRAWTGFEYTQHEIIALRSMINELALKSGGEYDVHILLHVKDDTIPIWSSKAVYQQVIEESIPEEFWGITTLWSVQLMRTYYPGPFGDPPANIAGQEIHGVYRSAHFAMQWFSQEHPEYDYIWNWEMDIRYSGNHYEFHQGVADWAKKQPRRGLWERNEKFWIPAYHGTWDNFTRFVDAETLEKGEVPIWGPVEFPYTGDPIPSPEENIPPHGYFEDNYEWGVGEEADLITFNPIFNPAETNWVFRKDISGYDLSLPIPPRRCAIITVSRLSRRLLDMMHEETYIGRHSAFPEMWPSTVALHHGFKAVYIPHPVYFDRKWPLEYMDQIFNYPENKINSPFGWGEHNWLGSSFYYNSGFSGALWRRWLGERENEEGGAQEEMERTGRMCLRSTLHHPIKNEDLPED